MDRVWVVAGGEICSVGILSIQSDEGVGDILPQRRRTNKEEAAGMIGRKINIKKI